jgi:hypothetical protein
MSPEVKNAVPVVIETVRALTRDRLLADALAGLPAA